MTKQDLTKAFGSLDLQKKNREHPLPGILGFTLNGIKTVNVPTRNGFVYVRLRNSTNELIQAFNDQVSPVYDLPVLVIRDEVDRTRYKIVGRDLGIYQNWGSNSPFLPAHGNTHSFSPDTGGGGDVTYVYSRQLMPLAVYPSGTTGAGNVMVSAHTYYQNAQWWYAGGTGTSSLLTYKPTGSTARMVLVYLDENANPQLLGGSTQFAETITGTSAIIPYLPTIADTRYVPLAGIRLVSGTSVILWDNIYDLRPWIVGDGFIPTGSSAQTNMPFVTIGNDAQLTNERALVGGAGISVTDGGANGSVTIAFTGTASTPSIPTYPAIYDDNVFKTTGTAIHYNNNLSVIVSGTSVWIDGSAAGGSGSDILIYEDNAFKTTGTAIHFNNNLDVIVTGSSVWIDAVGVTGSAGVPGIPGLNGSNTILIYEDSTFKVTGTAINFTDNMNIVVSGSVAHVSSVDTVGGGGGGSNLIIYDNSVFKVTGTSISFDSNLSIAVTGTTAFVNSMGGGELGYAQITGSFTTSSTSYVDVTGLSVTVTIGNNPIKITVFGGISDSGTDGKRNYFNIYDVTSSIQIAQSGINNTTGGNGSPLILMARVSPSSGARTYKVQMKVESGGGTGRLFSADNSPSFILVEEI